jgi:hypothetical protein
VQLHCSRCPRASLWASWVGSGWAHGDWLVPLSGECSRPTTLAIAPRLGLVAQATPSLAEASAHCRHRRLPPPLCTSGVIAASCFGSPGGMTPPPPPPLPRDPKHTPHILYEYTAPSLHCFPSHSSRLQRPRPPSTPLCPPLPRLPPAPSYPHCTPPPPTCLSHVHPHHPLLSLTQLRIPFHSWIFAVRSLLALSDV